MKKLFVSSLLLFSLILSVAVFAAPQFLSFTHNGTDNFYYHGEDVYFFINVTEVNASFDPPNNITLNCSYLGGSGNQTVQGVYVDGDNLTNTQFMFTCPLNFYNDVLNSDESFEAAAPIVATAVSALGGNGSAYSDAIIAFNMTTPPQMPPGCQRFGNLTTNFSTVPNFNSVNFIIQIEMNGSCLAGPGGGSSPWSGFSQVVMFNFTSLNMSNQTIGQRLANLGTALQVNITPPHEFGLTRVYINETAFSELNTNATITLNNIPFASIPAILADNASRLVGMPTPIWTLNTPWNISIQYPVARNISVPNGNLQFSVGGFSGFNQSDNETPIITINSPAATSTSNSVLVNVTVNGTITQPSQIIISGLESTRVYNSSVNTANCTEISTASTTYNCLFLATLPDAQYTLTVTAYDYGGSDPNGPGNTNSTTLSVLVDTDFPQISLTAPANGSTSGSSTVSFTFSATDNNQATLDCNLYLDSPANTAPYGNISSINLSSGVNTSTITGIALGLHNWTVECYDSVGNYNVSETRFFTVSDLVAPTVTLNSPADSYYTNSTSVNFNCTATDDYLENVSLFLSNSTGGLFILNQTNQTAVTSGIPFSFAKTLTAGTYTWNCQACDGTQCAFATNRTLTVDQTNPTFSTHPSASVTDTTATISWTTSENSNSSVDYNTTAALGISISSATFTTSNSVSLSSLTASTLYYYNVTSCDQAGNCNSNGTFNFTTSAATTETATTTTSSTTSGGGGSVSKSLSGQYAQQVWGLLEEGETAELPIENGEIGFTKVEFNAKKKLYTSNMKVIKVAQLPSSIDSYSKPTYKYIEVRTGNLDEKDIENAQISFKVTKSWLSENNLESNKIALFRYVNEQWIKLETTLGEDDGEYVHYTASTPGFSYFAIAASQEPAIQLPVETPVETPTETTPPAPTVAERVAEIAKSSGSKVFLGVLVFAIIIALVYFLVFKKNKRHKPHHFGF